DPKKIALLKESDVLIDGPFIMAERSLELKFRGSRNQRIIDVKKSLQAGEIILWQENTFELPEGPQSFGGL
ncbi:MAG: 4Fe-4S cluster-binding domain-containing protein, partial [Anaerotignum sp.]|nr:4Fe-4S cluster-binding domain-containing protein [Anaerotignum sp.]